MPTPTSGGGGMDGGGGMGICICACMCGVGMCGGNAGGFILGGGGAAWGVTAAAAAGVAAAAAGVVAAERSKSLADEPPSWKRLGGAFLGSGVGPQTKLPCRSRIVRSRRLGWNLLAEWCSGNGNS